MTVYSGKTSSFHHKWHDTPNPPDVDDCIQKVTLLEAQWTNCPIEVENEVKKLWKDFEFGNDHFYFKWNEEQMEGRYPLIAEYLAMRGVVGDCLIHWWW